MRNLTAIICLSIVVILGSGSANASAHCEDINGYDYDASECEGASSGKDQNGPKIPKQFGGIGFPSGPVKNSEIVNLLLGNTLVYRDDDEGKITHYFKKNGEVNFCIYDGKQCRKVKWSVRDGQFCEKNPSIHSGAWFCLTRATYNDKTGKLVATPTGRNLSISFNVQRGDRGDVDESNVVSKKTTSPNVATDKVTSEIISTTDKNLGIVAGKMTASQLEKAQDLARNFVSRKNTQTASSGKSSPPTPTIIAAKPSVTSSPKQPSSGFPACSGSSFENIWTNCFGTMTFADGTKYVGEYRDNKRHGQGTTTYADGENYVGEYKHGKRRGQGTWTFADGTVKEGIWENGGFKTANKTAPTVIVKKPSVTPAPAPKLVFSKQVFRSQELLHELGLYSGKFDGLAGSDTANAIKKWQQRNGLPKTGEVTEFQLVKLELEAIAHLRKIKSKPVAVASVKDINPDKYAGIEFGKYHALVIGINEYKHLPKLKTAVKDAEAVADVLKSDYGFDVNLLRNAKRSDVMDALDYYESNLGINDNLLIYYAGHGDDDKAGGEGYWHPADYRKDKRSSWISNSSISTRLRALKARHVIVVADSCYSGTLVRSGTASVDNRSKDVRSLNLKRSRGALTSGGLEQVVDSVGGNNSPFAKAFIDALNDNKGVVDMSSMYPLIRRSVLMSTEQSPMYSDIRKTGDEGGDFFFVRKK
jgi:hypothetical protein